ncbi:MAG: adenine phosphoribosyltransferase [Anaerolineae bacterium]|jgi:adenine phosphoribosyltransferase|nr:adenine phosphoribosyltransferase [Anaerolineae bacterium]MBT7075448.1 adenine phosphoribosyltransferase [Anaerolineae bacterium]MBT7782341.1 adenine phosphoribosyltransferase [Anaerolineae bacterium]
MPFKESYLIEIAGLKRELPLFEIKPGLKIAVLNILGDTELVEASAKAISKKLAMLNYDILITPEAKSIPIAHALSVATGKAYAVLRKNYKLYMGNATIAETLSITTGEPQTLILDEKDADLIKNKRVLIIDDVISTGSTLKGMHELMKKAKAEVVAEVAILTEGNLEDWQDVISLGHIPLFTEE